MPRPQLIDPSAPGLLRSQARSLRKVALFRASRLGDYICATPAIRALRKALPAAELSLVGLPFVEPLAERSAWLDRFFPFPGAPGIAEQFYDPRTLSQFLSRMQDEKFDLVVQMHGSGVYSNPVALSFGARLTAGFIRPGDRPDRLDAAFPYPAGRHEVTKLLLLAEFLGAPADGDHTEFPVEEADRREADRLLGSTRKPLIGIHASAADQTKLWDPARFAQAASILARESGGQAVLLGAERPAADDSLTGGLQAPYLDLLGATSLTVLGAVAEQLAVLLTNDSGPAHVAYCLGVPCVTVFGSTAPEEWEAPKGSRTRMLWHSIDCRPCNLQSCPIGYQCLQKVTVDEVVEAARAIMRCGSHNRLNKEEIA